MDELHAQGQVVLSQNIIDAQTSRLHCSLDRTAQLQDRLSRWTLTFNRRAATRAVQKKKQGAHEKIKKKQQTAVPSDASSTQARLLNQARQRHDTQQVWKELEQLSLEDTASTSSSSSSSSSSNKSRTADPSHCYNNDNNTASAAAAATTTTRKDAHERVAELQARDEHVIDAALDGLAHHVDGLLALAKAQHAEIQAQESLLERVYQEVELASEKQSMANHRASGFLNDRRRGRR